MSEAEYLTSAVDPLWSTTGNANFEALTLAQAGGGDAADVAIRLFGQPFSVPLPDDVLFHSGTQWLTRYDDGLWNSWSQIDYATATDVAVLESSITDGLTDDRFTSGVRVESTVGDGVKIVTLNYPATEAAAEEGWSTMTVSIGPELDGLDPTGRNAVTVRWEQNVEELNDIGITTFLRGWLAELPIPEDLEVAEFHASIYNLASTNLSIEVNFSADADRFEKLATYFAEERIEGALVLEGYTLSEDLSSIDEIDFGFFPTLADNDLTVEISRDLTDPSAPMNIRLGIDLVDD